MSAQIVNVWDKDGVMHECTPANARDVCQNLKWTTSPPAQPKQAEPEVAPVVEAVEVTVEEAPVEEAPVEEAPKEEAPKEEAPVEEAPVEEAAEEEKAPAVAPKRRGRPPKNS